MCDVDLLFAHVVEVMGVDATVVESIELILIVRVVVLICVDT